MHSYFCQYIDVYSLVVTFIVQCLKVKLRVNCRVKFQNSLFLKIVLSPFKHAFSFAKKPIILPNLIYKKNEYTDTTLAFSIYAN